MRPTALLLSILFSILPSVAQQPAQEKPPEKCTVEGMVVAAATGEPLKKARLALYKVESRSMPVGVSTDATGRFRLAEVEPGRYRLRVERHGYVGQEYGERSSGRMWERRGAILTLLPGQKLADIVFKLVPAAVITGRIYDTDGESLPGARVTALRYGYTRGQRQLLPEKFSETNDLGEYPIWGLPPGSYYVSALYTDHQRWITGRIAISGEGGVEATEGYVPTYYPGTNNESQAVALEVRPGDELRGIDFSLLAARAVRIRGRVFNTITGKPGRGVMLWLTNADPMSRFPFDRDFVQEDDGSFEMKGVQPGSYILIAQWMQENKRYTARQQVEVGTTDLDGISLVIAPGIEISGRLRIEGAVSGPVGSAGKKEEQAPDISDYRIWLEPRANVPMGQASATVKADSTFVLENVAPDDYQMRVFNAPPDAFIKSARLAGEDVLEEGVRVTGPVRGTLEVVVSLNGAVVEGVVTKDGQAFSGATVVLIPEGRRRERPQLFKTTTTDQYGRFTLRGIAPGEYKLFAWEEIEPGAHQDPEFLRRYEDDGTAVRLAEGSRASVELKLIPAGQDQ